MIGLKRLLQIAVVMIVWVIIERLGEWMLTRTRVLIIAVAGRRSANRRRSALDDMLVQCMFRALYYGHALFIA